MFVCKLVIFFVIIRQFLLEAFNKIYCSTAGSVVETAFHNIVDFQDFLYCLDFKTRMCFKFQNKTK